MRHVAIAVTFAILFFSGAGSAQAGLDVFVDQTAQLMSVVIDGLVRYVWNVSTGLGSYGTPNGIYVPERLEQTWYPGADRNAPMPYAILFDHGYAIHGGDAISRGGRPASHGCVRLPPERAAILYDLVRQHGRGHTRIVVSGGRARGSGYPAYGEPDGPMYGGPPVPRCEPCGEPEAPIDRGFVPDAGSDDPTNPRDMRLGYQPLPRSYWSGAAWRWWPRSYQPPWN